MRVESAITRFDLPLTGVEEFEVLLQHEKMFRAVVSRQRRDDLRLRRAAAMIPVLRELCGSRWPATMSRMMRSPVRPVISLTTNGSCRFIWHQRFLHALNVDRCGLDAASVDAGHRRAA